MRTRTALFWVASLLLLQAACAQVLKLNQQLYREVLDYDTETKKCVAQCYTAPYAAFRSGVRADITMLPMQVQIRRRCTREKLRSARLLPGYGKSVRCMAQRPPALFCRVRTAASLHPTWPRHTYLYHNTSSSFHHIHSCQPK